MGKMAAAVANETGNRCGRSGRAVAQKNTQRLIRGKHKRQLNKNH